MVLVVLVGVAVLGVVLVVGEEAMEVCVCVSVMDVLVVGVCVSL